ncbi:thiamine phosphate synthase [Gammaproteobacteria bacterium]|nr:thiamine phosphate synthase [Gammaproteobacteria bacterium]
MLITEHNINKTDKYFITPNYSEINSKDYYFRIEKLLDSGIKIIQFRSKNLKSKDYSRISRKIYNICKKYDASYIINDYSNFSLNKYCDGIQLTSNNLKEIRKMNLDKRYILIGSCHNIDEIKICNNLKINLILISPVFSTSNKTGIGWKKFKELVNESKIPVFALGGLKYPDDIENVKINGGVGIAASKYFYSLFDSRQ